MAYSLAEDSGDTSSSWAARPPVSCLSHPPALKSSILSPGRWPSAAHVTLRHCGTCSGFRTVLTRLGLPALVLYVRLTDFCTVTPVLINGVIA